MKAAAPALARVPVIPEPPFDPTSLLIDERMNWWVQEPDGLQDIEVSPCDGALSLALLAGVRRRFTEESGSFGGLVPPAYVTLAPDGSLLLLDRRTRRLKRFDPCRCCFVELPCLAGGKPGGRARDLRNPKGIAACADRLYVCDPGRDGRLTTATNPRRQAQRERIRRQNHRVSVFLLPGLELLGYLRPSPSRYPRWLPVAVACDSQRCIWVLDAHNGAIHRFTSGGHATAVVTGLARPEHLAIDRCGRLYVIDRSLADGVARLRVFDREGQELPPPARVEQAALAFPRLTFEVHADGTLDLGPLCHVPCPPGSVTFDPSGQPIAPHPPVSAPYLTKGVYSSRALDSRTRGCQWHRVVLHGEVPAGTRVLVESFCADEDYDADQVAGFAVWARGEIVPGTARGPRPAPHDCLVFSPPGRYLWLRLTLLSATGSATPVIRAIEIEFPRLSSLRYLPAVFAAEAVSADLTARFLSLFDTTLRGIERVVDTEAGLFDPASTPATRVGAAAVDFLTWLASWIGITFERSWSEARRRRFLSRAGALFARRGTVAGLRQQLLQVLGWEPAPGCGACARSRRACHEPPLNCAPPPEPPVYRTPPLILEHFKLRRWLHLGIGRLGAQAVLWGQRIVNRTQLDENGQAGCTRLVTTPDPRRDPLHVYAHRFTVFVPACVGRDESGRRTIGNLLRGESPAHAQWDVVYVEPRFRIGVQSMIGFDAVVGGLPAPARVGGMALGQGTLVGGGRPGRSDARLGRSGRIGTGSRLH
jgi:phage tail-like protein